MKKLNIVIAGLGNVGSAVVNSINNNNSIFGYKSSININIIGISARNRNKKRQADISKFKWYDNPIDLINIKNIDVLIELIGEEKGISFELTKLALEKKVHVITGNKAMIANHGNELFYIAEKNNVRLLYEASVAGGIPIIKTIKNILFLNSVKKISGILNGTTNYILTKMQDENMSFENVLNIAKEKGYTSDHEAKLDIGGFDSAHKLTILSSICFGCKLNFSNNIIQGISEIKIEDINFAQKLNCKIKLVSESFVVDNKIFCVTAPKLIENNNPLSKVNGVLNAISIETDHLENLFLEGPGAGGVATASSVISDLYEIASSSQIPSLGYKMETLIDYEKFNALNNQSPYYIRIMTKDMPGVLSKITKIFTDFNISVKKILQLPESSNPDNPVPIIIVTHQIKKIKLLEALTIIEKLEFVLDKISILPIDQQN